MSPLAQGTVFLFEVCYLLLSSAIWQELQPSLSVLTLISDVIILRDKVYWVAEFEKVVLVLALDIWHIYFLSTFI